MELSNQGRGNLACRGSVVTGKARRARPGTSATTWGDSALRALASSALRTPESTNATPGSPKTRRAALPQLGHDAEGSTSAIGRTISKLPQAPQRY
jgi:hypothetical protein